MSVIQDSINLFEAERLVAAEKPRNPNEIGDFEGLVTGVWVKLASSGLGIVNYKDKKYKTVPLGAESISAGTKVQMNYSKGIYYSKW